MMAKMFYTMDEAKAALGKSEDEMKALAREGRLREFRDGPRLMFKADQVEQLKNEMRGGESGAPIDLGPSDSGMAIGLADSRGPSGTGTGLTLADTDGGRSPGAGMTLKEDTALAADLGLSGSVGGMPSPGRSAGGTPTGTGLSGNTGSRGGIDVFQPDEVEKVDPMAQTNISQGVGEQVNLEGVGSGSGLLDLTRESDDTSLGAELLDEIAPSGSGTGMPTRQRPPADSNAGSQTISGIVEPRGGATFTRSGVGAPIQVEAPDATASGFAWAALGATAAVLFGAFAVISGALDTQPPLLQAVKDTSYMILAGGGLALAVVFFVIGLVAGKATAK